MIKLFINDLEKPLDSVWYHYRDHGEPGKVYGIRISLTEQDVIDIIERYANVKMNEPSFEKNILIKDRERRSLGLIWNLFLFLNKNGYIQELNERSMAITINNIKRVVLTEEHLELIGDVSVD